MRVFFVGFLMTGLFLVGLSVFERRQAGGTREMTTVFVTSEDGTPMPRPKK
jgi:hypothetical protein